MPNYKNMTIKQRLQQLLRQRLRLLIASGIIVLMAIFYGTGTDKLFTLEQLQQQQQHWQGLMQQHQLAIAAGFFSLYTLMTALSIPAASLLTLLAGSLFGFWPALLMVSFASSLGATLAFLMARFVIGETLQQRLAEQLPRLHKGFEEEGAFYLFALRLVPLFPFFVINLAMGLLPIRVWTFYWVSQLGMLAGTAVYVYAGTRLAQIRTTADIVSPEIISALILLAVFPLISKTLLQRWRQRQEARQQGNQHED